MKLLHCVQKNVSSDAVSEENKIVCFLRIAPLGQLAHFTHFCLSRSLGGMIFTPKSFWYYNSASQTSVPPSLGLDSKHFEVNRKTSPDCSNFGSDPKPCTFHSSLCLLSFSSLGTSMHVSWLRGASRLL